MRVAHLVEQSLKNNIQSRSSDKVLLLQVWHSLGLDLTPRQVERFLEIPSPETIGRVRRKLQESGKYLPTEEVKKARRIIELQVQQNAPSAKPERLEKLMQGELL